MPTLPSGTPRPEGAEPHRQRAMAQSFGADAEAYDRLRPRYPDALIRRITAAAPGPDVLDVGIGTGIAARQLRAAGCRVLGVEPDARMAEQARRFGDRVEIAAFEQWDPAGRRFDAVVSGQAWHWIDPAAGAAQAARALRPGGVLALFWNVFRFPEGLGEAVAAACRRAVPDAPVDFGAVPQGEAAYRPVLDAVAAGMRGADAFDEPEETRLNWEFTYSRDAWLAQMATFGLFTRLPAAQLDAVLAGTGEVLDAAGGSFTMDYTTLAATARRRTAD